MIFTGLATLGIYLLGLVFKPKVIFEVMNEIPILAIFWVFAVFTCHRRRVPVRAQAQPTRAAKLHRSVLS